MATIQVLGFEVYLENMPDNDITISDLSKQLHGLLQNGEFTRYMYDDPARIIELVYQILYELCDGGDLWLVGLDSSDQFRNVGLWEHIDVAAARVNEAGRRGRAAGMAQSVLLFLFPEPMDHPEVASMAAIILAMLPKIGLHIDVMQAIEAAVLARVERSGKEYEA